MNSPPAANQPRTILITGGNSGLGRASAGQLAQQGHELIITSRDPARRAQAAIRRERDPDLADFQSIRDCVAAVTARWTKKDQTTWQT